jgi:hypothetical protein
MRDTECREDRTLFDAMNPSRVGLFSNEQLSRSVIRGVFALGSGETGVLVLSVLQRDHHHTDPFTASDN